MVELILPPASMSDSFGRWLDRLSEVVRDVDRFGLGRRDCDLYSDFQLFSQNATSFVTGQMHIQTAAWQLQGALRMQRIGAPPSAVPPLARAALEAASAAAWFLAPDDAELRVERLLRIALQDSYDQYGFEGPEKKDGYRRRREHLHGVGQGIGRNSSYFDGHRFSTSEVLRDLGDELIEDDLSRLWSLLSGLSHGRMWAIGAASGADLSAGGRIQMYVPREQFGFFILRVGEVLDLAIRRWNQRVGSEGTTREVPRLSRDADGRAPGLPPPPWTWSPS